MNQSNIPFFSIGITTYNRPYLLKQILNSLLQQDFADFEIIIGNDYIPEPLTKEILGIDDKRITIINNTLNLGELGNMNSLLAMAKGRYFTWQFDDDLCAPSFLSNMHETLAKYQFPKCIFSSFSYAYGNDNYKFKTDHNYNTVLYTGRCFLRAYLGGKVRALGLGGFHEINYLKEIGGAERLSNGKMALYSEYLLILRAGLLPNVAYINARLVANRVHNKSWSCNSTEVELFKQAGISLIRESLVIFVADELKEDFTKNLTSLLISVISVVITKSKLAGKTISNKEISEYLSLIKMEFVTLKENGLYDCALTCLNAASSQVFLFRVKALLKVLLSFKQLKYAHIALSYISKYTNKSF